MIRLGTAARRGLAMLTCALALVVALAIPAAAHEPGSTLVEVSFDNGVAVLDLQLPTERLELATGMELADAGDALVESFGDDIASYIADHVGATGADGAAWDVVVGSIGTATIDDVDQVTATMQLIAPEGTFGEFELTYDVILDFVRSHEIVVAVTDLDGETVVAGTLNHRGSTLQLVPDEVATDFGAMVQLGFDHVIEGVDHLLFLLVLLLPAPLLMARSRWDDRAGAGSAIRRVAHVATAFAIGHSLTLVLSSFGWLSLPTKLVESLIAVSIIAGAAHVIRPVIRRGEALIAAGFGLVHGLAFAAILDSFELGTGSRVTTLLGFNLGVELAQAAAIVAIFPLLFVASRRDWYRQVRVGGALVATTAALLWLADRLGLAPNVLEPVETAIAAHLTAIAAGALGLAACLALVGRFSGATAPEPTQQPRIVATAVQL